MSLREVMLVGLGLAALILVQLGATHSFYLLHKYFWTDELCTYTLITDGNLLHALGAMRGAVDINPPGLHILLLAFTALTHSTSEVALRSFALLSMLGALVGIYCVLRDFFGVLVAVAAVLAVWSHPLILDHAFEVRYYGPWLSAAVWFCFLLGRARAGTLGRAGTVALGAASFFLCTVHYFGIVSLGIIVAAQWVWERKRPMFSRAALVAIAVGPLATAAALAFLLPSQRSVTTVATWIPDPSVAEIADFGMTVFLPLPLAIIPLVIWLSRLTARSTEPINEPAATTPVPAALIGLTSLALLVPALIVFSIVVQPALTSRYGLPSIAALAPAVAYTISRVSKPWIALLVLFLIASSAFQLHQRSVRAQADDRGRRQLIADIRERSGRDPVLFEVPHQLNIVWHYAPDLRGRVFLLDFAPGQLGDNVAPFRIWSRDLARQFVKYYDGPALLPWDDVRRASSILVVPHDEAYKQKPADDARYPGFNMTLVQGHLYRLVPNGR